MDHGAANKRCDLLFVLRVQIHLLLDLGNCFSALYFNQAFVGGGGEVALLLLVEYDRILVLAADATASSEPTGLVLELPLLARILLEVEVLVAALIEDEFGLVEVALQDEVVDEAGFDSADAC